MQTAQLPNEEITAGDTYETTIVFKNVDYSAYEFTADVRAIQRYNSASLGSFEIGTPTYDAPDTTLVMTLDSTVTRAIGNNGGGYWDLQYDDGDGAIKTPIGQRFTVRQDVTEVAVVTT